MKLRIVGEQFSSVKLDNKGVRFYDVTQITEERVILEAKVDTLVVTETLLVDALQEYENRYRGSVSVRSFSIK